jgi:heme exporter protein A
MLSAQRLCLYRGERCLFKNLGFALNAGELLLIEGPNGSGKTSLLRAIAGLLSLDEGEVRWRGEATLRNRQSLCAEMSWLAHRPGLKNDLTMLENLRFDARLRGATLTGQDQVLTRLGLDSVRRLPVRALSAGQQRRVALARLLLSNAQLWLMDEPFTNLDSAGQALVLEIVGQRLAKGGACVIASHQPVVVSAPIRRIRLQ